MRADSGGKKKLYGDATILGLPAPTRDRLVGNDATEKKGGVGAVELGSSAGKMAKLFGYDGSARSDTAPAGEGLVPGVAIREERDVKPLPKLPRSNTDTSQTSKSPIKAPRSPVARKKRAVAGSLDALMNELGDFGPATPTPNPSQFPLQMQKKGHSRKPSGMDSLDALMSELQPAPGTSSSATLLSPQNKPSITAPQVTATPPTPQPPPSPRPQRPSLLTKFDPVMKGSYTMSPDTYSSSSSTSSPLSTRSAPRTYQQHKTTTSAASQHSVLSISSGKPGKPGSSYATTLRSRSGGSSQSGSLHSPLTEYEDDSPYPASQNEKIAGFEKQAEKIDERIERNIGYEKMVEVRRKEQVRIEEERMKMEREAEEFERQDRRWREEEEELRLFVEEVGRARGEEASMREEEERAMEKKRKIEEVDGKAKEEAERLKEELLRYKQEADAARAKYEEDERSAREQRLRDDKQRRREESDREQARVEDTRASRQSSRQKSQKMRSRRLGSITSNADFQKLRASYLRSPATPWTESRRQNNDESEYEDESIYDSESSPRLLRSFNQQPSTSESLLAEDEARHLEKEEEEAQRLADEHYAAELREQAEAEEERLIRFEQEEAERREALRQAALRREMEEAEEDRRREDERLDRIVREEEARRLEEEEEAEARMEQQRYEDAEAERIQAERLKIAQDKQKKKKKRPQKKPKCSKPKSRSEKHLREWLKSVDWPLLLLLLLLLLLPYLYLLQPQQRGQSP